MSAWKIAIRRQHALGVAFVEGRAEVVKQPLYFRTGRRPEVVRMLEEAE